MNRKSHCICSELNLQRSTRLAYDSIELKIMNTVIPPFHQKQGLYAKSMEVSGSHWGVCVQSSAHLSQIPPEVTCCVRFSSSSNSHHLFAVAKNFPWQYLYWYTHKWMEYTCVTCVRVQRLVQISRLDALRLNIYLYI